MKKILSAIVSRNLMTGVLAGGALLFMTSNAMSQPTVTMADLAAGGSITNGDKVFYDFSNISQVGDLTVPLSSIYVVPTEDEGDLGFQFQSALWTLTGANQTYDLGFNFEVKTTNGQPLITDDTLEITGATHLLGDTANISEVISLPDEGGTVATSLVWLSKSGSYTEDNEDLIGGPYAVLEISKDFSMVTANNPGGHISVSHFDQTFSQVPEPSSALFLGLGGLVLACYRRFTR
jgi:hypothetical protein